MDTLKHVIDYLLRIDWLQILTFIAVIFGIFNTWYLHRRTYKDEYYKKIIDKRMAAYELLENILRSLFVKNLLDISFDSKLKYESVLMHNIFSSVENFKDFRKKVVEMGTNGFWFSKPLIEEISKFSQFLFEIEEEFNPQILDSFKVIGSKHHEVLVNYYVKLRFLLNEDFKNLYKVEEFLNKHGKLLSSNKSFKRINKENFLSFMN